MFTAVLLFLKTLISGFINAVLKLVNFLIEHPKLLVAVIIVGVLGVVGWKINNHIKVLDKTIATLKVENTKLQAQVTQLQVDIANAKEANDNNQRTIKQLESDQKVVKGELDKMKSKHVTKVQELNALQQRLNKMTSAQDGPISEVLKAAIEGIQGGSK